MIENPDRNIAKTIADDMRDRGASEEQIKEQLGNLYEKPEVVVTSASILENHPIDAASREFELMVPIDSMDAFAFEITTTASGLHLNLPQMNLLAHELYMKGATAKNIVEAIGVEAFEMLFRSKETKETDDSSDEQKSGLINGLLKSKLAKRIQTIFTKF